MQRHPRLPPPALPDMTVTSSMSSARCQNRSNTMSLIAAEHRIARTLRKQHARRSQRGIPDLLRSTDHQPTLAGLASTIHVAVAHAAPLMCVPVLLQDAPVRIDAREAEETRDVQHIGQALEPHREIALQAIRRVLRQIRIGALVIGVERDLARFGHGDTGRLRCTGSIVRRTQSCREPQWPACISRVERKSGRLRTQQPGQCGHMRD